MVRDFTEYSINCEYLGIIEFEETGNYYYVVIRNGMIQAGSATNTGLIVEFEYGYDDDLNKEANLLVFYERLLEYDQSKSV